MQIFVQIGTVQGVNVHVELQREASNHNESSHSLSRGECTCYSTRVYECLSACAGLSACKRVYMCASLFVECLWLRKFGPLVPHRTAAARPRLSCTLTSSVCSNKSRLAACEKGQDKKYDLHSAGTSKTKRQLKPYLVSRCQGRCATLTNKYGW